MPIRASRRRIEIDAEVYGMLEKEAAWLHIPVTSLATLLIRESVGKRFRGMTVEMDQRPIATGIAGPGAPLDPWVPSDQVSGPALGVAGLTREEERAAVNARDEARLRGQAADVDPLERDHSPSAIAEALAPVRHPDYSEVGEG